MYRDYADFFKGLSNPRRIKLLKLLTLGGNHITVAQLVEAFDEDASTVSRYLNHLRKLGILHTQRNGQTKVYWLDHDALNNAFSQFIEFLSSPDEHVADFVKTQSQALKKTSRQ